jgi:putative ABC transport system permease protein
VSLLYDRLAPRVAHRALPLLAVERARRVRESAAVAVSGVVVASLSLAVALTVMVASFRDSVTQWLDAVLPAELYVRTASRPGGDTAFSSPPCAAVAQLPGVAARGHAAHHAAAAGPGAPAVTLIARALDGPLQALPLVGEPPARARQAGWACM